MLRWRNRILLLRHEKGAEEVWLLPGGGVNVGESLLRALQRELWEETGLFPPEPSSRSKARWPSWTRSRLQRPWRKHVVHVIFAADVSGSLEDVTSQDTAVRGHRAFALPELDSIAIHPPIQRFLQRWQPGDPAVYLGEMWTP